MKTSDLIAMKTPSRRFFLQAVGGAGTLRLSSGAPAFTTRGVVLIPEDFTLPDWPGRVKHAGLTTVALHHGRSAFEVIKFITSEAGRKFLDRSHRLGLQVEYEIHAMGELLPRWMFERDKTLFRMNKKASA
jgi:hypothetical protein